MSNSVVNYTINVIDAQADEPVEEIIVKVSGTDRLDLIVSLRFALYEIQKMFDTESLYD